jgi:hypothetical protein
VHGACWADLEVTAGGAGQCIEAREGEAADVICTGELEATRLLLGQRYKATMARSAALCDGYDVVRSSKSRYATCQ